MRKRILKLSLEEKKLFDCLLDPVKGEEWQSDSVRELREMVWSIAERSCFGLCLFPERCEHAGASSSFLEKVSGLDGDEEVRYYIGYSGQYLP